MEASNQPNTYLISSVTVEVNSLDHDLIALLISEDPGTTMRLTLEVEVWQRVADRLAAAGITPEWVPPAPGVLVPQLPPGEPIWPRLPDGTQP